MIPAVLQPGNPPIAGVTQSLVGGKGEQGAKAGRGGQAGLQGVDMVSL